MSMQVAYPSPSPRPNLHLHLHLHPHPNPNPNPHPYPYPYPTSSNPHPYPYLTLTLTYVLKVIMSPDGKRLATCSADQTVKIWDIQNNFACDKTLTGHQRWVWDAVYSEDSAYLVTASSDQP